MTGSEESIESSNSRLWWLEPRWPRFTIKALLFITTVAAVSIFGLQKWRHHQYVVGSLYDGNWSKCWDSVNALKEAGKGRTAVRPLIYASVDYEGLDDYVARQVAIIALGNLGQDALSAVPALQKALMEDPDMINRVQAARALWKIDRQIAPCLSVLEEALEDPIYSVRYEALRTLDKMDPTPEIVNILICEIREKSRKEDHYWICNILGSMGPAASSAIPALNELLADENMDIRNAASRALERISDGKVPAEGSHQS